MKDNTDPRLTEWLTAASAGDSAAQEALFRTFSPPVYRLCLGLLGDVGDAEEVLQDSFVYALRNLRRYDARRASFRTWLFTIAISRCRNKRRRKWLAQVPLSLAGTVAASASSRPVEAVLAARGVRQELWQALQLLPYAQRETLVLRFFGGMAYKEIGALLACKPKTAESRARLGLKALRGHLAQLELETELTWVDELT